jgi:hypothetical protein
MTVFSFQSEESASLKEIEIQKTELSSDTLLSDSLLIDSLVNDTSEMVKEPPSKLAAFFSSIFNSEEAVPVASPISVALPIVEVEPPNVFERFSSWIFNKEEDAELNAATDTTAIFYKKYKKRKNHLNETKGKPKKIWIDGDILSLYKEKMDGQSSMMDSLYNGRPVYQLHRNNLEYYLQNHIDTNDYKSELEWAEFQRITAKPFNLKKKKVKKEKFVYGFHPFWMGNAYFNYDFNTYDRIGYYGYIIDPETGLDLSSGGGQVAHSWSNSSIQEKAILYGCKTDLCLASYEIENNIVIFENSENAQRLRTELIANVIQLVKAKGNGVCIDIQKVPVRFKSNYINLIKSIREGLNGVSSLNIDSNANIEYEITVLLPRFDVGFPYHMNDADFKLLAPFVDRWIVIGESFYGAKVDEAELTENSLDQLWDLENLDLEINHYPKGLADKLLLEIPYHYSKLTIYGADTVAQVNQYRNVKNLNPDFENWFKSKLREKLAYANLKEIKGVAVWGMGYAANTDLNKTLVAYLKGGDPTVNPDIKALIEALIAENKEEENEEITAESIEITFMNPVPELDQIALPSSSPISFFKSFLPEKFMVHHVVVLCIIIFLFFVVIGVLISLFYEDARELIFSREYLINIISLVTVLSLVLLLKRIEIFEDTQFVFAIGILIGIVITIFLYRKRKKKEEEERP